MADCKDLISKLKQITEEHEKKYKMGEGGKLLERIDKRGKTEDEIVQLYNEAVKFLESDAPEQEKDIVRSRMEILYMVVSGIQYRNEKKK